jgi:hypothetical protein
MPRTCSACRSTGRSRCAAPGRWSPAPSGAAPSRATPPSGCSGRPHRRVRALQSHGTAVGSIGPGTRAAVALAGVDLDAVGRGRGARDRLRMAAHHDPARRLVLLPTRPRSARGPASGSTSARSSSARGSSRSGGSWWPATRAPRAWVLDGPVVARAGDRFVLRSPSPLVTIGGGTVRDPLPCAPRPTLAGGRGHAGSRARATRGRGRGAGGSRRVICRSAGAGARCRRAARRRRRRVVAGACTAPLRSAGGRRNRRHAAATRGRGARAGPARAGDLDAVDPYEASREPELVDALLREAVAAGRLELEGGVVRRGWKPRSAPAQSAAFEGLARTLEAAVGSHPVQASSAWPMGIHGRAAAAARARAADRASRADRYYSSVALADLMSALRAHMEPGRVYNPVGAARGLGCVAQVPDPALGVRRPHVVTDRAGRRKSDPRHIVRTSG